MKTKAKFTVTLTLSDNKVSVEDFEEITERILNGLCATSQTCGITPENSDVFTEEIDVRCEETGFGIMQNLML